jgi:hypothetical protein
MHDKMEIENPCSMDWSKMAGDEKARYCNKCQFNVYNFSEMSQEEIDNLLNSGNRVCARLYVRLDGTYMTKSCSAKRKRNRVLMFLSFAALLPIIILSLLSFNSSRGVTKMRRVPVIGSIVNYVFPEEIVKIGEMCVPTPPVKKQQAPNTTKSTPPSL